MTRLVCATWQVSLLLQLDRPPLDVTDVDAAAAALLAQFCYLAIVVIALPGKAYVVRYTAGHLAAAARAAPRAASAASQLIVLPARKLHYTHLDDKSTDGGKGAPTPSGAADAFCAGFMVALGRGLSVRQALVWAYSCGQLSAMQPSTQLEGTPPHLTHAALPLVRTEHSTCHGYC
jgi:hypothetical protein